MRLTAKVKAKVQKKLGALRDKHWTGGCWVCGSHRGRKTSRESEGPRCRKCFKEGRTTADVLEYERLKGMLSQ